MKKEINNLSKINAENAELAKLLGYVNEDIRNGKEIVDNTGEELVPVITEKTQLPIGAELKVDSHIVRNKLISMAKSGYSERELREYLEKDHGYKMKQVARYISEVRSILDEEYRQYAECVAKQNIITLKNIMKECIDTKNYKTAIEAIRELNRMCNITSENKTVNAVINTEAEQINIQFD